MSSLATASNSQQSGSMSSLLILLLPLLLLGFLFWSQRRRARNFQQAQAELTPGMEVTTTSGLRGTLLSIDADVAELQAAPGVVLRFDRRAIIPLPAGPAQPAADAAEDEPDTRPDSTIDPQRPTDQDR